MAINHHKPLRRIGIVGRPNTPELREPLQRLLAIVQAAGCEAKLEAALQGGVGLSRSELIQVVDAVIVLGGDGSLLGVARLAAQADVALIGVNQGRFGFLTDIAAAEMEQGLPPMLAGHYSMEKRPLLQAAISSPNADDISCQAFNDMVISRRAGNLIDMAISLDHKPAFSLRADGLIISTPTGSTAYALSAGGPIIHPSVAATLLVPVAPFALTMRPIVLSEQTRIDIRFTRPLAASLHADGQEHFELTESHSLSIQTSSQAVKLLHPLDHNYYAVLRNKLAWSETAETFQRAT
jgi:NAD+ kinase